MKIVIGSEQEISELPNAYRKFPVHFQLIVSPLIWLPEVLHLPKVRVIPNLVTRGVRIFKKFQHLFCLIVLSHVSFSHSMQCFVLN